jgi:hypothetical protein
VETGPVATVLDLQQGGFFERATVRGGTLDLWGTDVPLPGIRSGTEVGIVFDRDGSAARVVTLPADPSTGTHRVLASAVVIRPAGGRYTPGRNQAGQIYAGRDPSTRRTILLKVGPNRRLPVELVPNFGDDTFRTVDPDNGADLWPARPMRDGWRLRPGIVHQSTVDSEGSAHIGPLRVGVGLSRASRMGGATGTTPGAPIRIVGDENAAAVTVWGTTPTGAEEVLARVPVVWGAQRDPVPEDMGPVPDTRHPGSPGVSGIADDDEGELSEGSSLTDPDDLDVPSSSQGTP